LWYKSMVDTEASFAGFQSTPFLLSKSSEPS
jgi:hypothetical protein